MDWHRLLCRPLSIILSYISTEIHPALSLDNECRVDFSGMHLLKVPGNKIPFCYVIFIITFVSCSSVILIHWHQFSCILWKWHRHPSGVQIVLKVFWRCYQSCNNFIYFFPNLSCVNCMFSYCLKWNHLPKIFSFICTLFFCMDLAHPEIFMWIYYGIACSNCVWIMYHTEICLQTASESQGCQSISHKQFGDKMAFRLV